MTETQSDYVTKRRDLSTSTDELVRKLADLFDEVGPDTPEEVNAVLVEAGYDPDEVGKKMGATAAKEIERIDNLSRDEEEEVQQLRRHLKNAQDEITFYRENWYEAGRTLCEEITENEQLRDALSDTAAELESVIEHNKILQHGNQTLARHLANARDLLEQPGIPKSLDRASDQEVPIYEDDLIHHCGQCGAVMQIVRPGKYQCPGCE